jgi:hypothetical protein
MNSDGLWILDAFGCFFRLPVCNSTLTPSGSNHFWKIPKMLFRQNFRRRHQRDVEPLSSAIKARTRGHGRFARTDIALQKPPHRMRAAHVARISRRTFVCAAVNLKPSRAKKRFHQTIVAAARQRFRPRLKIFPARLDLRCNATNSSSASRRRAISTSVNSSGK